MRIILPILLLAVPCLAQPATTQPAPRDATLDWLLEQAPPAQSSATTAPTTQPRTPFVQRSSPDARRATITYSDGSTLEGNVTTTPGKPIRIWDEAAGQYRDVPFRLIRSVEAEVLWERDQPEWKFVASGSDVKETTGRTYPTRELIHTVTLINDQQIRGTVVAPLYFESDTQRRTLVLHKRQKGEVGQTLTDLLYIRSVSLSPPAEE